MSQIPENNPVDTLSGGGLTTQHLRQALECTPVIVWTTDKDLCFTSSSGGGLSSLGLKPSEVVGQSVQAWSGFDHQHPLLAAHRAVLKGQSVHCELDMEGMLFDSYVSPLRDPGGEVCGVLGVAFDIAQRRRSEQNLSRIEKLESLAQLAGRVAHDFNNLLMTLSANLGLAQAAIRRGSPVDHFLSDAESAVVHGRSLTQQLLSFARGESTRHAVFDLNALAREASRFVLGSSRHRVELTLEANLPAAEGDEGEIYQALANLLLNADQAMTTAGVVKITTGERLVLPRSSSTLKPGKYVYLTVSDTGPGIPAKMLPRIFQPYVTTKPTGTGLGLASACAVCQSHGGTLEVDSPPGQGASFTMLLQLTGNLDSNSSSSNDSSISNPLRILVVEDEPDIRALLVELIEILGHQGVPAATEVEALEYVVGDPEGIDLALLDLHLGGHDEVDVLARMRLVRPEIRALACSGASPEELVPRALSRGYKGFLAKPFTLDALRKAIGRAME